MMKPKIQNSLDILSPKQYQNQNEKLLPNHNNDSNLFFKTNSSFNSNRNQNILNMKNHLQKSKSYRCSVLLKRAQKISVKNRVQLSEATQQNFGQYNLQIRHFAVLYSCVLRQINQLQMFFQYPYQLKLLYRASQNQYSVDRFHQLCDDQGDTVTLCRTNYNQIIGGYTSLSWKDQFQKYNTHFKTDKTNSTFIFSITKREKYYLTNLNKNKAICCFKKWGPTFGGGYDLLIGDKTYQNANSISYFPRSFTSKKNKQANHKYLTGCKNNQFKIIQWEVFKFVKKQQKKNIQKQNIAQSFFDQIRLKQMFQRHDIINQKKKTQIGLFNKIKKSIKKKLSEFMPQID